MAIDPRPEEFRDFAKLDGGRRVIDRNGGPPVTSGRAPSGQRLSAPLTDATPLS